MFPSSIYIFKFFIFFLFSIVSVAVLTLLERKVLSIVGLRLGPSKVSFIGILQPVGDALKLFNKSLNSLYNFSFFFYYFSSFLMLFSSFFFWFFFCSEPSPLNIKVSLIFFFIVLSLNSIGSIICGWSTFSKYSLIGSIRTVSQLISYEAVLYFSFFFFIYLYCSYSLYHYNFFPFFFFVLIFPFCFYFWVPSVLADLNRSPFDFSEGESELVSGFNVEAGSSCFTFIFLSEYMNIIFICFISFYLFFWGLFFFFFFFLFFLIWIRSVLPRFRFDKLMYLSWKFFIPFLTFFFIFFFLFCF